MDNNGIDPKHLVHVGNAVPEVTDKEGNRLSGSQAHDFIVTEFYRVLSESGDSLTPVTDVYEYARTTANSAGQIRPDDEWQPHQSESGRESAKALYDLGFPAQIFSTKASELLMFNPPNTVPDFGDGTATV